MAFGNDISLGTVSYNQGQVDAVLKNVFSDEGVADQFFKRNPTSALLRTKEDVGGRLYESPVWAGTGQAISSGPASSFSTLQTAAGQSGEAPYNFIVDKRTKRAVANISDITILDADGKNDSFVDYIVDLAKNQLQQLSNDIAYELFRPAVATRGVVAGSVAGTSLTLQTPSDITNFELNMMLDFASNGNVGGTIRQLATNNTSCQVTAIDYSSNTMTVKWNGTGTQTLTANNVAAGDYIARFGDFGTYGSNTGTGTTTAVRLNGLTDWIPYGGVSSSDSFLNVNRSANATRLAGNWMDGTGGNLEEILEKACNRVALVDGGLSHFILPFGNWTALCNSQSAKTQIVNVSGSNGRAKFGFEGLQVIGPDGPVTCYPDRSCPSNTILGIERDSWLLISKKPIVHTWQEDGKVWFRSYNQAGMEIRFLSHGNLVCKKPVGQINIRVNPLSI